MTHEISYIPDKHTVSVPRNARPIILCARCGDHTMHRFVHTLTVPHTVYNCNNGKPKSTDERVVSYRFECVKCGQERGYGNVSVNRNAQQS